MFVLVIQLYIWMAVNGERCFLQSDSYQQGLSNHSNQPYLESLVTLVESVTSLLQNMMTASSLWSHSRQAAAIVMKSFSQRPSLPAGKQHLGQLIRKQVQSFEKQLPL